MSTKAVSLFDREILLKAIADSFRKLDPRHQLKNPVMFVTLVGAILTFFQLFTSKEPFGYVLQIALWLLFTVLFANFAEAVAEGRGKAQARALRDSRRQLVAHRRRKDGFLRTGGRDGPAQGRRRAASSPASRSPATATSSRAPPRWTSRPSPANPRRSSARPAATAAP